MGDIQKFFSAKSVAVAGASDDPSKYGHKIYAVLLAHNIKAFPLNPRAVTILGNPAFASLAALPERAEALSIVTPPVVTEKVVDEAIAAGVKHIWMQPGAEHAKAIEKAAQAGINVIANGPCLLVEIANR